MNKFKLFIIHVLFLFGVSFPKHIFAEETKMISLADNIYMHPAKNVLEVLVSREDLLNQDLDMYPLNKQLMALFKDDFDGYVFVRNLKGDETSLGGWAVCLNNQVHGIGQAVFRDERYSDRTRWRGYITLTGLRYLFTGPLIHEICHLYGMAPDLGQVMLDTDGNETATGSHWGVSDVHGFLGGFDAATLTVSGNRYQASSWISQFFNEDFNGFSGDGIGCWKMPPLEMYLMGLVPLSEVPDVHVYKGLSETNAQQIYKDGTFTASEVLTYTQDDLLKKWGKRVPDYMDAPKEFSFLVVILTDIPLTDEQWSLVQEDIQMQEQQEPTGNDWPLNFWEATQGKGTILFSDIDKSLCDAPLSVDLIQIPAMRVTAAKGQICIKIEDDSSSDQIVVTDVSGRLILQRRLPQGEYVIAVNRPGVYIVKRGDYTMKLFCR